MKIIIASPFYQTIHGGVITLHKLCHILNEIGFDAYMIDFRGNGNSIELNPNYNTKNINLDKVDKEKDIIVYPEIVRGNPYGFKKCVRYILYYNEKRKTHDTWGENDFWLYFIEKFYDGIKDKNILKVVDTQVDYFKNLNKERKKDSCYTIRKGSSFNHISKNYHPTDSTLLGNVNHKKMLEIFNNHKRFYSYDPNTYMNTIASLCGCESIIVPIKNVSKNDWEKNNQHRKYGIAYGIEDIENCKNVDKLREILVNEEKNMYIEVNNMFDKILDYFKDE